MDANPAWTLRTGRLELRPVDWRDLPHLRALKADPRVFALMLGGIRSAAETARELAVDVAFWSQNGCGIWSVHDTHKSAFLGITGFMERTDGRGIALRFAFWPEARGRGIAREAAGAALRFGHERAGLPRIVAVARETNFASRTVLGGIGMIESETFLQDGHRMVLYESVRAADAPVQPLSLPI